MEVGERPPAAAPHSRGFSSSLNKLRSGSLAPTPRLPYGAFKRPICLADFQSPFVTLFAMASGIYRPREKAETSRARSLQRCSPQ